MVPRRSPAGGVAVITTLAFRHLWSGRSAALFLLLGFAIGVGVMVVLLSVGEAMLDQSRDVSLVGGGEVTVLPQGIDVEAMRTGGLGGMFFAIERARFLTRQALGGPRHAGVVRTVAPAIEGKLLYLCPASGRVPTDRACVPAARSRAAPPRSAPGSTCWRAAGATRRPTRPTSRPPRSSSTTSSTASTSPRRPDSTWGEWHYFNLVTGPDEWWYVTFLVGGEVSLTQRGRSAGAGGCWSPTAAPTAATTATPPTCPRRAVAFDTARADLSIGESSVRQRDGVYRSAPGARRRRHRAARPDVRPEPNRYFPPVELRDDEFLSGYVVPALAASATRPDLRRRPLPEVSGASRPTTTTTGASGATSPGSGASARGGRLSLLYGGVYGPERSSTSPFFLTLVDSLGVRQVLRFGRIELRGEQPGRRGAGGRAPRRFTLTGTWEADTVILSVAVEHALATEMGGGSFRRLFLQMRGEFRLRGTAGHGRTGRSSDRRGRGLLRDLSDSVDSLSPMTDFFQRLTAALGERYALEREIGAGGMATVYLAGTSATAATSRSRSSGRI